MPVGTKFENSSLKSSFSLSSLRPSTGSLESPEHARLKTDRAYHSLTKKRKEPEKENWRRSWGSIIGREENNDEFWAALQANYDYIMDNNLIDSCSFQENNGELISTNGAADNWSRKELSTQFSELYWYNSVQEAMYGKKGDLTDKSFRNNYIEELKRKVYASNEQEYSSYNDSPSPSNSDETCQKKENLQSLPGENQLPNDTTNNSEDVDYELRRLRKWIREMESTLQPLSFRHDWTIQELEEKALEHMVLQRDIESHGKVVSSVVKSCERYQAELSATKDNVAKKDTCKRPEANVLRVAQGLERRWHLLFLRSLEWQCHIETLVKHFSTSPNSPGTFCDSESDEEPVLKQPRLSNGDSTSLISSTHLLNGNQSASSSDTDDGSYFEDGIENLCSLVGTPKISSETKTYIEKRVKNKNNMNKVGENDKSNSNCKRNLSEKKKSIKKTKTASVEESLNFTKVDYNGPNNVTYYFKHNDTDSEMDMKIVETKSNCEDTEMETVDDSSEEEWTYTGVDVEKEKDADKNINEDQSTMADETLELKTPEHNIMKPEEDKNKMHLDICGNVCDSCTVKLSKDELDRLVHDAEKLVTPTKMSRPRVFEPLRFPIAMGTNKQSRVKEWLKLSPADNLKNKSDCNTNSDFSCDASCDASGEYTTGESDLEKESQSSEDFNGSVVTFKPATDYESQATSSEVIADLETTPVNENKFLIPSQSETYTPKVKLRNKRQQLKATRPWSVACISQLKSQVPAVSANQQLNHFSISESALHELAIATMSVKYKTLNSSSVSIGAVNNTSNSSTVEADTAAPSSENSKAGVLRRKKLRMRKKLNRKSESGSESQNVAMLLQYSSDFRSPTHVRNLVKSGSFSGSVSKHVILSDRNISSDPSNTIYCGRINKNYLSTTSGPETDEEKPTSETATPIIETVPQFKLGPKTGVLNVEDQANRDSSPEKTSLNTVGTEEHSSLSVEWDNYLENYMSEPYSEARDSEGARRILNFGEDYSNYIDRESDCCSSLSTNAHDVSPIPLRRRRPSALPLPTNLTLTSLDSESDLEEFRQVIKNSHSQFCLTERLYERIVLLGDYTSALSPFTDIVITCRENLRCLRLLLECQGGLLSASEFQDVKALVGSWSTMKAKVMDLQRARSLQREMTTIRDDLLAALNFVNGNVETREELEAGIHQLNAELSTLQDRKRILLHINVAVHRFLTDCSNALTINGNNDVITNGGTPPGLQTAAQAAASAHLKDSVADLYRLWSETHDSVSERLVNLQRLSSVWSQFEARLKELQSALKGDENTLRMLDKALQGGAVSADVATSVRDVAKVLSEKPDTCCQNGISKSDASTLTMANDTLHQLGVANSVDVSGSFSDSGISDEGSEQDLSERERRLAALRRLARQLENALAPGSLALQNMAKRMEETESELRDLQKTCRALIVRTAVCAEVRARKQSPSATDLSSNLATSKNKMSSQELKSGKFNGVSPQTRCGGGDPDDEPGRPRSWLWRVMRASLPFQLAIVALFCVACLLEPHCCDRINNFSMSLSPQLRYVKGPPPV